MKIVITAPQWLRPDVFELWCKRYKHIAEISSHDIIISVAVSEDESEAICRKYEIDYIYTDNRPLGKKFNKRLLRAKSFDPDYVLLVGSDDLLSDKTFLYYTHLAEKGYDVIHCMDIYYYNRLNGDMKYCVGYLDHRKGEPLAPGRMLSKRMLDKLKWRLWDDNEDKFTDGHVIRRIRKIDHKEKRINLKGEGLMMLDVKSSINLTPLVDRPNNYSIDKRVLYNHFEKEEVKRICAE